LRFLVAAKPTNPIANKANELGSGFVTVFAELPKSSMIISVGMLGTRLSGEA